MDKLSFQHLYQTHNDAIYQYIFYLMQHKELAEDLTQETFYRAFKQFATFREEAEIKTWLKRIARNLVYDHFRRKQIVKFIPFVHVDERVEKETPSDILERGQAVATLYEALKGLKLSYREAIVLRKIDGLSVKEAAAFLGCTEKQVTNNTARALKALQKIYEERGYTYVTEL
ncbi:RNA polymerase sigma factor [Viridibacillus sp. NPDC096237]|uniref:RNA polymerase sigma factor n=1 Tax=Viridibacillus sp. NPDC096237 TaxID=3390721 RepID=UPI003D064998